MGPKGVPFGVCDRFRESGTPSAERESRG
jgi:hypothetical protein